MPGLVAMGHSKCIFAVGILVGIVSFATTKKLHSSYSVRVGQWDFFVYKYVFTLFKSSQLWVNEITPVSQPKHTASQFREWRNQSLFPLRMTKMPVHCLVKQHQAALMMPVHSFVLQHQAGLTHLAHQHRAGIRHLFNTLTTCSVRDMGKNGASYVFNFVHPWSDAFLFCPAVTNV